ncbi:hypothetical protein KAU09_03385 [Candidatus Parcubacteria bacterium]|nr:hypothetical protein [Candidatus Parcubacteria bacterium]
MLNYDNKQKRRYALLNALKNNQTGISLLELSIALMILISSLIPLTQAFPYSSSIIDSAKNDTIASYLTQEKIEEIISLGYENTGIDTIETRHSLGTATSSYLYLFERESIVKYVDADLQNSLTDTGLKKISTTVYYNDKISNNEKTFTISTLLVEK